jgi:predicted RNA binding protein YcfA (HicA-like mRNA interferase family)
MGMGAEMPRKLRQLRADLRREGWAIARQRGSHQTWKHSLVSTPVILAGDDGDDADHYQERDVRKAIQATREAKRRKQP